MARAQRTSKKPPRDARPSRLWRVTKIALVAVGVLVAAAVITGLILHEPRPEGRGGEDADALARRLLAAVDADAWERTGAIRWDFAGRHEHLWDKSRNYARVRWDDTEVLLRLHDQSGIARVGGQTVGGERGAKLREEAHAHWVNDAFWLNPVVKLFDEGTSRTLVALEEERADEGLLLTYASGGLTPGDAYLWIPGPDGLPTAWKMWVSIIPIGGVRCTWEGWTTLATGAKVSTRHDCGAFTLELGDVEGAADVITLEGEDPFIVLQ